MAATYTNNLNLAKPAYGDSADVGVINGNMDALDTYCHDTRFMEAHAYDDQRATAYAVGEYCIYLGHYYRCTGATSGAWDSTKWVQTTIGDELEDIASEQGVSDMTGATASTAGTHGLVPAPAAGDQDKVLMGSGTWGSIPTPTTDLADLDDVSLTTPTGGQMLTYDDTNDEWVNADAPDVTKTSSGNPVEFDDGADAPLVKCVSAITGSQDLHGYDKPWVGGAGKNQYSGTDKSVNRELVVTLDNDLPSGIWFFSAIIDCNNPENTLSVVLRDANNTVIGTIYVTHDAANRTYGGVNVTADIHSIILRSGSTYATSQGYLATYTDIMLESGAYSGSYAPYSNICPITAYTEGEIEVSDGDGNVTTHTTTYPSAIYRGSEDVVGGSVTCQKFVVTYNGIENWIQNPTFANTYYVNFPSGVIKSLDSIFTNQYIARGSGDIGFMVGSYLNITDPINATSLAEWKAYLSAHPLEVCYELATPTTSSVTPTNLPIKSLSGYNHIESTTGDLEVEYITQREQPIIDLITDTSQHIYSTAERIVGEWIDGSVVYEKSYKVDNVVDDNNYVLDAQLTQSAITLLPGTEVVISCTGTYNTDFTDCISNTTFGRVIANVNGLGASIVGYPQMATQLGTCTLYVTARYLKKTVSRSTESLSKGGSESQEEPLVDKVDKVKEVENDEKEAQKEPVEEKEEPVEEEPVEEPSEEEEQNEAER